MAEDMASTAVVVNEISQPNVAIQLSAAGTLAPSTPKVGAGEHHGTGRCRACQLWR